MHCYNLLQLSNTFNLRAMTYIKNLITCVLIIVMAIPEAKAQVGILNDLLGSANIQGTVLCTSNDNVGVNGAAIPVFSSKAKFHCHSSYVLTSILT